MMKNIFIFTFLVFLTHCGFKITDSSVLPFNIKTIETEGYNKINFLIKNNLLSKKRNLNQNKSITIKIETNREKEISEKNIRNEVTKYRLIINSNIKVNFADGTKTEFRISKKHSYRVGTTSLETSKNQDNLERILSNEITSEIKKKLFFLRDDS